MRSPRLAAALAVAAMASVAAASAPAQPPPPPPNPNVMLPDEADGGGGYLSLLLSSQARALGALARPADPIAATLADMANVLLTLHDSVAGDTAKPFHGPPLAALFAAGQPINTTAADKALSIADKVLDELAAADWTQTLLSKRVIHALRVDDLFGAKEEAWEKAKNEDDLWAHAKKKEVEWAPAPAPPPVDPWPSKGQQIVDEVNASPAAADKAAAADARVAATQGEYDERLADAAWRGEAMQAQRPRLTGDVTPASISTELGRLEEAKFPALSPSPNKTIKGYPLPPPRKQVVDVAKPGANASLVESERHLNLTKARFPIAPNGSDFLGPVIDVLTADPVGTALSPALSTPIGRDPKFGNPISSYTTTSTFGVGQSERK